MASRSKLWSRLIRDYVTLGDIYVHEGKLSKAAKMYARGGRLKEAARTSARAGAIQEAVQYFERAGDSQSAGELLVREGRPSAAASYLEKAGSFWAAGEAALQSKQLSRAAALFEMAGAFDRAADCCEQAGDLPEAARMLELEIARQELGSDLEAKRKLQLRCAQMLAKVGEKAKAARLLEGLGESRLAGEVWLRAEDPTSAAKSFLKAGLPQRALSLLDSQQIDLSLQARILSETSHHEDAAKIYGLLGDWQEQASELQAAGDAEGAARLLEDQGESGQAAEIFLQHGLYEDAARNYMVSGHTRAAADAFSQAGLHQRAAGLLLEIDEPVLAARAFIRAEDHDSAAKALTGVSPAESHYEDATLLLAPLLLAGGRNTEVLDRLDKIKGLAGTVNRELERSYWRGRALEAKGRLEAARDAYERVVARKEEHRDAASRVAKIGERLRSGEGPEKVEVGGLQVGPGTIVNGRYAIEREIGKGGMSRVYRAVDRELGERVAMKMLYPRPWDTSNAEERLINEVQICRKITHPNVVRVYDFGRFRGGLFITMELLEGLTLDFLLREHGLLPVARTKALLEEVLRGLGEAHRLRILHRDLKPGNIVVTPDGAKLMDFGIARLQDADVSLTQTGQVIGSPMYMSPEQVQGLKLDARSDLYGFGVLAFTLLVGHEPYRGRTPAEISVKHLREPVPVLSEARHGLDAAWSEMITKLLQKKPEDRYDTTEEVLEALRALPIASESKD